IRSYQSYNKLCDEIFYWQPTEASQCEVDFLLKKGNSFCAIEAKATTRIRKEDLKGLIAISNLKGLKRKIIVYQGRELQRIQQDIEVYPIHQFIKEVSKGLF
ncbi:MAG: hypothetical protein KDD45_02635, partial [Bdellovibrionales bacterium]|nr:hypothetical protein [Bdellovibrionales bacterium]